MPTVPYTLLYPAHSAKYHFNSFVNTWCKSLLRTTLATHSSFVEVKIKKPEPQTYVILNVRLWYLITVLCVIVVPDMDDHSIHVICPAIYVSESWRFYSTTGFASQRGVWISYVAAVDT
jgi:hypothetical protein